MMDSLRSAATGWMAKILIGLLALSFGIWGINDVFRGYRSDVLASVGDYEISAETFRRNFDLQLRSYSRQAGQPITSRRAIELGLDRQILGQMLRDGALQQKATEMKLAVPDAIVVQEVHRDKIFQNSRGEFDANRFRQILQQNGLNEQIYLQEEKVAKQRRALVEPLIADFSAPDILVDAVLRQVNEERDARYFELKANESELPAASEGDLKSFYEKNPQLFTAPAYRSLALLKVEPQDLVASINVTDDELLAAYEKRKAEYSTPERRQILQITFPTLQEASTAKERIDKGTDFLSVAKERGLSEKDATLGELARNDIPDKAIADAAFALSEGAVSQPVEGRLAKALLKVTKIYPEVVKSFAEVREDLRNKIRLERAHEEILTMHGKVEDERAGGANFESIAKTLNISLITVPAVDAKGFDKADKPVEIPGKTEVLNLAFESDVGVETDPIPTKGEGFIWVEVRDATAAAVRPFAEVKDEVRKTYTARKLREQVLKKASDLVKRAQSGTSLETLAQEVGAEIKTEAGLKRNETTQNFDAAAVSALFLAADNGFSYAPDVEGRSAKIMQALPISAPAYNPGSKDAEALRNALQEGLRNDLVGTYISAVQKSLGVIVNDQLWRQTTGAPQ
ncbi:MAG TPA: SurA N-terminal domain-containing protein [Aestuariivirgaceae bacterium]|jgi:peptidyl-prolyl cis-trans isomerase D